MSIIVEKPNVLSQKELPSLETSMEAHSSSEPTIPPIAAPRTHKRVLIHTQFAVKERLEQADTV